MGRWARIAHVRGENHRPEPVILSRDRLQSALVKVGLARDVAALRPRFEETFQAPWPTLAIFAGADSLPFVEMLRARCEGATGIIYLGPLSERAGRAADIAFAPEHFSPAPVFFAPDVIEDAEHHWLSLGEEPGLRLSARVRGDALSPEATRDSVARLEALSRAGGRLWVTLSPSTPVHLRQELRTRLTPLGARVWESEAVDGPNPYVGRLLFSHLALVGTDDPEGAAEAAYFGLPVAILGRQGALPRWANLEIATDRARLAEPGIKPWATEAHRPVDVAADAVVAHLSERYPPARW
jgi:hypothetical protein